MKGIEIWRHHFSRFKKQLAEAALFRSNNSDSGKSFACIQIFLNKSTIDSLLNNNAFWKKNRIKCFYVNNLLLLPSVLFKFIDIFAQILNNSFTTIKHEITLQ